MDATILTGDCLVRLRELDDESVDACVTDPPYGLGFMGKSWDHAVPSADVWREVLRVLKPGAHLLAFAGTRTQHRMACAIEDAGFEIRDLIAWLYGSGFPKSKNLDGEWSGWGTALKPALEPITIARKPLRGTVAANVLAHGTGAINVDGCRVAHSGEESGSWGHGTRPGGFANVGAANGDRTPCGQRNDLGRWPANVCHDGSDDVVALFPYSESGANPTRRSGLGFHGANGQNECDAPRGAESGSAARFFYSAKADAEDRNEGLPARVRNRHPTVKPVDLMRYLCRLVTRPGGLVLDPFMGSGSTGKACALEGFNFIGCELDSAHVEVAQMRIEHAGGLFAKVSVR